MVNPMNIYIKQLASAARERCVEQKFINKEQYIIDKASIEKIIKYFNGTLKKYDSEKTMLNEYPAVRGNSFVQKTGEDTFTIGYVEFIVLDILHELGHVFLELETMEVNEVRSCNDVNGGINEIGAAKFARAFLFSSPLFEKAVIENSKAGACNIQDVANKFGVDRLQVISYGRETYLWE